MNWRRLFGGKDNAAEGDYRELALQDLQPGSLVDYDLQTWEVTAQNQYEYDGEPSPEWVLRSGDQVRFLEPSTEDGRTYWTWTREIDVASIGEPVADTVARTDDPPEEVHFEGVCYRGTESSAGLFREGGTGPEREFIVWTYEAGDRQVLFISQWGDKDFAAYAGEYVEEYQFTNILPPAKE